jgi:PAS domain S-box-containing protein/excisionase family DNA binding protein
MDGETCYLETAQVCNLLGIHRSTLWRLVREGRLRHYDVPWSKHPRYLAEEVRLLREHPVAEEGAALRAWAELAAEAVWLIDVEGRVQYANPAAAEAAGRDVASLFSEPFARLVSPQSLAGALEALEQGMAGRVSRIAELALLAGAGARRLWETSFSPVVREGVPGGVLVLAREVTERAAAERLRAALQSAVAVAPRGVLLTDPKGEVQYANAAAAALLGSAPDRMVGRRLDSWWSPANPAGAADAAQRQALEGPWQGELLARAAGGGERWLRVCLAPAREGARITAMVALLEERDTEQECVQNALKAAQLQGAVLALQALEGPLTEPLLALRGNLQLLRMSLGSVEGLVQQGLEGALAACAQLAALGDSLWALAGLGEPPVGGPPERQLPDEEPTASALQCRGAHAEE